MDISLVKSLLTEAVILHEEIAKMDKEKNNLAEQKPCRPDYVTSLEEWARYTQECEEHNAEYDRLANTLFDKKAAFNNVMHRLYTNDIPRDVWILFDPDWDIAVKFYDKKEYSLGSLEMMVTTRARAIDKCVYGDSYPY